MVDLKDYPDGDGRPNCPDCHGRGVVPSKLKPGRIIVGGSTIPCGCILERDILRNVERGWKGLTKAAPIPASPLIGYETKNVLITATHFVIREHMRHVAIRQGTNWYFSVVSDADLMDAWLARIDDPDIGDGDVVKMRQQPVTSKYGALVDMVEPPELLVIIAGVKAARNSAMPEVMLEALQHRLHKNKPTWVVDQPEYRLVSGHISYSGLVGALLDSWPRAELGGRQKEAPIQVQRRMSPPSAPTGIQVMDMGAFPVPQSEARPYKATRRPTEVVPEDDNPLQAAEDARQAARDKKKWGKR